MRGLYFTSQFIKFHFKHEKNCVEKARRWKFIEPGKGGGEFVDFGREMRPLALQYYWTMDIRSFL